MRTQRDRKGLSCWDRTQSEGQGIRTVAPTTGLNSSPLAPESWWLGGDTGSRSGQAWGCLEGQTLKQGHRKSEGEKDDVWLGRGKVDFSVPGQEGGRVQGLRRFLWAPV